eukprot:gene15538-17123_t
MDIERTVAIPGLPSTPKRCQIITETLEDQDSDADDDGNNNAVTESNQHDHMRERGERKKGKSKKKIVKELEAEKTNALMEMSSQGRELVAAVKKIWRKKHDCKQ